MTGYGRVEPGLGAGPDDMDKKFGCIGTPSDQRSAIPRRPLLENRSAKNNTALPGFEIVLHRAYSSGICMSPSIHLFSNVESRRALMTDHFGRQGRALSACLSRAVSGDTSAESLTMSERLIGVRLSRCHLNFPCRFFFSNIGLSFLKANNYLITALFFSDPPGSASRHRHREKAESIVDTGRHLPSTRRQYGHLQQRRLHGRNQPALGNHQA